MLALAGLAGFSALWLATVASPGPNFVRITHLTLTRTPRFGMAMAFGTATGNCLWCLLAILSADILLANPAAIALAQTAGGTYLAWCALRMMQAGRTPSGAVNPALKAPQRLFRATRWGLETALTNPQAVAFFGSIQVVLFPAGANAGTKIGMVALTGLITLIWYGFVVSVLRLPRLRSGYLRYSAYANAALSLVLLALAVRLLWSAARQFG